MNKTISRYLTKNILYPRFIKDIPQKDLGIIVVIPCHNEPDIISSILSIARCDAPLCTVEVIVSINAGENDDVQIKAQNLRSEQEVEHLKEQLPPWLKVYAIVNNDLVHKKAGVGLGRKIGMDEAAQRFLELEKKEGVIVCYDADSSCPSNFLKAIEHHFQKEATASASIHYEHAIDGSEFSDEVYTSIIQYELHLRYFIYMQNRIDLPYAFHTVGSSMACKAEAYCAVGGMNQRKAGEDFYFIHKLVKYGKHTELNSTKVIPSPRISDRVPFGTGRAIGEMQNAKHNVYYTYTPQSFYDLEILVKLLPKVYYDQTLVNTLPEGLREYLQLIHVDKELERILQNTSDYDSFHKMFWHWFDAFQLMKYLHYVRDKWHPDIPVFEAVNEIGKPRFENSRDALIYFRQLQLSAQ